MVSVVARVATSRSAIPTDEMLRLTFEMDADLTVPSTDANFTNPAVVWRIEIREWTPGTNGVEVSGPARVLELGDGLIADGIGASPTMLGPDQMAFHAPRESVVNGATTTWRWQNRRTIDLAIPTNCVTNLVKSDGTVHFDIRVLGLNRSPVTNAIIEPTFPPDTIFNVNFDLIQVTRATAPGIFACVPTGGGEFGSYAGIATLGDSVGADMNASGTEDNDDILAFFSALQTDGTLADFNYDQSIDDADVQDFLTDLADPE